MKLIALSPFSKASRREILKFFENANADLVVLPGYSAANTPSPSEVQEVINDKVSVFVESKAGIPYLITKQERIQMPKQQFYKNPKASDLRNLVEIIQQRTHIICKRKVTFILCGEIIAFNPNGGLKHHLELPYGIDIVVNPAHYPMGHWNYLNQKLTNLSRKAAAVHVANNTSNHVNAGTDVRIYRLGKWLNNKQIEGNVSWCECNLPVFKRSRFTTDLTETA